MQIPTLLLGVFNGSVAPDRDLPGGRGLVCRLLSRLLGPGGPVVDLQMISTLTLSRRRMRPPFVYHALITFSATVLRWP